MHGSNFFGIEAPHWQEPPRIQGNKPALATTTSTSNTQPDNLTLIQGDNLLSSAMVSARIHTMALKPTPSSHLSYAMICTLVRAETPEKRLQCSCLALQSCLPQLSAQYVRFDSPAGLCLPAESVADTRSEFWYGKGRFNRGTSQVQQEAHSNLHLL